MINQKLHSRAVSYGMRRWHCRIPKCKNCRKVRLVDYKRRGTRLCAKCERLDDK